MCRYLLILFCLLSLKITAQEKSKDSVNVVYDLSARFLYNSIWTERVSLQQFTTSHPVGVQLDFGITKNSQPAWNYCNCYMRNGISLAYFNFRDSRLGDAYTFSFFTEPTVILKNNFSLSIRGSAGLAHLTKLYDSSGNKYNIFFSASLNYYLMLGLNAKLKLSKNVSLSALLNLNHISNGGKKDPNEGMNFFGTGLSFNYILNPVQLKKRPIEKFTDTKFGLIIHAFGAQRTAQATPQFEEEARIVSGLNFGVIKRVGRMNAFGLGGEWYYDGINSVYQSRYGQLIQTSVGGVNVQHYLFLGKLLFGQQLAWFVTPNTGYDKNIYQRYFLEYEIKKNWYAGLTLKSHGDHSDYLAFSLGRMIKF